MMMNQVNQHTTEEISGTLVEATEDVAAKLDNKPEDKPDRNFLKELTLEKICEGSFHPEQCYPQKPLNYCKDCTCRVDQYLLDDGSVDAEGFCDDQFFNFKEYSARRCKVLLNHIAIPYKESRCFKRSE